MFQVTDDSLFYTVEKQYIFMFNNKNKKHEKIHSKFTFHCA